MPLPPDDLVDRTDERARLGKLLLETPAGGTALLIEGVAGIGKTALARDTAARARERGFQVLLARGVQSTAGAGFGGLHELLYPILDRVALLPPRQRSALLVAFGQEEGPAADRMLISLATLSLLEESASTRPLLILVEDLHWLDRSSAEVVAFLARRLGAVPVTLLAMTRTDGSYPDWSGSFPHVLPLDALSEEYSGELLDRVAPGLGAPSRERILSASSGNPLALQELPAALRDRDLPGSSRLPLTERLEQAFLSEVGQLPPAGQRVLRLAAAGEDATAAELVAAMGVLGLDRLDLDRVERTGLLRIVNGRLVFRHPLLASAVQGAASSVARAEAHRALAEVSADPVRVAWHRSAATYGWDEDVAAGLDAVALAAQRRGAHHEAMVAYRRAAELSPAADRRVHRLAEAAEAARRAGLTAEAAEVLQEALPAAETPADVRALARTEWLLSMTASLPGRGARDLVRLAGPGSDRPVEVLLWAATKAFILQEPPDVREEVRAALERAPAETRDEPLREIGFVLLDPRHGMDALRSDLGVILPRLLEEQAEIVNVLAFAAEGLGDFETAERCWTAAVDFHHASGRISDEAVTVCGRGMMRVATGRIADGLADSEQALRLSLDFDLQIVGAIAAAAVAVARAVRGEDGEAAAALEQARQLLGSAPFARVQAVMAWAAGLLALNEGRPQDALTALAGTTVNPPVELWAGPDLVEAAVRAQRPGAAGHWLELAEAAIAASPFPDRLAQARDRSLALLGTEPRAHFEAALAHGARAGSPLDLGRTRLAYGEWLRRDRLIAEARTQLTEAVDLLRAAGATPWATRAEAELGATGGGSGGRQARRDAGQLLTSQELQVARLAAQGLTNREIADRVYVSHRTVADHLSRAFLKLGISRRSQLSSALEQS
ncbi:LuxR family transcriptional regulator [Actinoplanes sp. NPDC048796]|uniref:ATP-binding protein n=1 Tax=unclassified Actinoplanes TaxID=2626549 RepID=UPI0033EDAA60